MEILNNLRASVPIERMREGRDFLLQLYACCKRAPFPLDGIPLQGRIKKSQARLQAQSERILDLADWLDAMSAPEETNAKFDAALTDLAKGDVIPWAAVQ